MMGRSS